MLKRMNAELQRRGLFGNKQARGRVLIQTSLLVMLMGAWSVTAQDVFMPRPTLQVTPPALQQFQADEMEVFAPAGTATQGPPETPFRWGQVRLRPMMSYRFLHGDGIPAGPDQIESTAIQELSPGVLLEAGNHWTLDYTPTWRLYSNRRFKDTVDHAAGLAGGTTYGDWGFRLAQRYNKSSAPLVETGAQTDQEVYATTLGASYQVNSKMSLDFGADQKLTFAPEFQNSREWSTLNWLNYQFWPRFDASLGAGFGYVNVDTGFDMTYEQLQGRIAWRATDKISLQLRGGFEVRQFLDSHADDVANPVAGAVIQYQPFEVTKLLLNADRVVASSLMTLSSAQNQITETTRITVLLNQRLLRKLHLDLGGGYYTSKYVASSGVSTGREDDYYSVNARLSCVFLKRGTAAVFWQYSDNSSSATAYSFSSTQVGFEIGYRY